MNAANDTAVPSVLNVCESFASATWRIHRYEGSILLTHILDAGKRGKGCAEFSLASGGSWGQHPTLEAAIAAILPLVAGDVSVKAMRAALKACEVAAPYALSLTLTERGLSSFGVPRAKIEVTGPAIVAESDGRSWALRCRMDRTNEPTSIACDKRSAALVLGWIRERSAAIVAGLTYVEARAELTARGVKAHSYYAID
jgi:hypothetical protein